MNTRHVLHAAIAAAALAATALPAAAQQAYTNWDTFGSPQIDFARWLLGERVRAVRNGALELGLRDYGDQINDTTGRRNTQSLGMDEPARITQMRADVTMVSMDFTTCPANATTAYAAARVIGGFFNTGTPNPDDQTGDVIAQVNLSRRSNSVEPAGVLNVRGVVSECTNFDCTTSVTLGIAELGLTSLGSTVRLTMEWEPTLNLFRFRRDAEPALTVPYAVSDAQPPGRPFKNLDARTETPACFSGPRTVASALARFDNVSVNVSGTP